MIQRYLKLIWLGAALIAVVPALATPTGTAAATTAPTTCPPESAAVEELRRLREINAAIERGELTLAQLREQGIVKDGEPKVYRQDDTGAPMLTQQVPFREILLPLAKTGFYYPTKISEMKLYSGLLILMPGIGVQLSNAKTLFDIAQTFNKGTKLGMDGADANAPGFRLLAVPADTTLNGFQKGAAFAFATAEGSMAVLRHIHLVLRLMHPGLKVFVAGRSQGGLMAAHYAGEYADVAGAMGVNITHPDPAILPEIVRLHEDPTSDIFDGIKINFDRSWDAFKETTGSFMLLMRRPSQAPVLLLIGRDDPSYPNPFYLDGMTAWVNGQSDRRRMVVIESANPSRRHNLWGRRSPEVYEATVSAMVRFVRSLP